MGFSYEELGQRLKAYRLGSGLGAEELAKRLGISRTALYRFEQGELAKIETLEKLAELHGVSIPTLLGVGIEYIPSAISYFERVRQIEETAEQIVVLAGPISFLLASDEFLAAIEAALYENADGAVISPDRARSDIGKISEILRQRRELYSRRKPAIVNIMSAFEIERFLDHGLIGRRGLPRDLLARRKQLARAEVEHFVDLIERQPMGVQIGIVPDTLPHAGFQLIRQPQRKLLVMSPFRLGAEPNVRVGVAMITSAPDAVALHEQAVADMWGRSLKGQVAATFLREMLTSEGKVLTADRLTHWLERSVKPRARA
jgi:transcriptional regulator with XRE-family HTH domain